MIRKHNKHKINNEVRFNEVRLIGRGEPILMSSYDAYQLALSEDKDLILVNENQNPPIVKIEDYNKFIYNIEKIEKEKKKNAVKIQLKEIQLSPNISDNDLNTKIRKGREFLEDGNKIKCVLQLKGRQKATPERGEIVVLKYASGLEEIGTPETMPKLDGGRWIMILKPKK